MKGKRKIFGKSAKPAHLLSKRRRRFGFYKGLLVFIFVMLAVVCAGTIYFWRYIEAYEASRLDYILRYVEENVDYAFWEKKVESVLTSRLTEFEVNRGVSPELYRPKIRDVQYTLRQKNDESTAESPVYYIRAGARDIGIVRFTALESVGYGFYKWEIGSIEFLDSFVRDYGGEVSVTASHNAEVRINGIPLTEKYLTECDYEYGKTYLIQGIFYEVEVSVTEWDGKESSPYHIENGQYFFPIKRPFSRKFKLVVPDGSIVLINGETVPQEYAVDAGIIPDIFNGFLDTSLLPVEYWRYEINLEDLYEEPVLFVTDGDGAEMLPTGSNDEELFYKKEFSTEYKEKYSATVEAFIRAYVGFGANIGNNAQANFNNVSKYILRDSELYRRTQNAIEGMTWVRDTTVTYNSLEIDSFMPYGDEYFTCEVRYNITNRTNYETRQIEGNYDILFVLSGDRWLAAKMDAT